jgi:hypothetical protein
MSVNKHSYQLALFTCVDTGFIFVPRSKNQSGYPIKKNEMGGAYGACKWQERCIESFDGGPEENRPVVRRMLFKRIILIWLFIK